MQRLLVGVLLAAVGFSAGCGGPTPEKIETWKGTQRGPQKLHDVVADDSATPELRGLAAAALVEIGLATDAVQAITQASTGTRAKVVHEAVAPLVALLGTTGSGPGPTTPVQRSAKDVLFEVRTLASETDAARINDVLIKWTTADLAARSTQGGESSEKILSAIGRSAASALVAIVRPGSDLLTAAKLIGDIGDPDSQKQATLKLEQAAKAAPGGTSAVADTTLQAIGLIGGDESTRFLLDVAKTANKETREKALFALAQGKLGHGNPQALAGALAIAGDAHSPPDAREAAIQVLEKLGGASVPGLTHLFTDSNTQVRFRAMEAALDAGGAGSLAYVLAALPQDRPYTNDDFDALFVHYLVKIGKDAVPPLRAAVAKRPPLCQIAALRALAQIGTSKDVDVVAPLIADSSACPLLKPSTTVGSEAKKAEAALAARH